MFRNVPDLIKTKLVNPRGIAMPPLLKWFAACNIQHDGTLVGIVQAALQATPHDEAAGRQLKRTEIPVKEWDARITPEESKKRLQLLANKVGLYYNNFVPSLRDYDCLLIHASYLPELLLIMEMLIHCWKSGLRWKTAVFLGTANPVGEERELASLIPLLINDRRAY